MTRKPAHSDPKNGLKTDQIRGKSMVDLPLIYGLVAAAALWILVIYLSVNPPR